jgi:hypothetical protein
MYTRAGVSRNVLAIAPSARYPSRSIITAMQNDHWYPISIAERRDVRALDELFEQGWQLDLSSLSNAVQFLRRPTTDTRLAPNSADAEFATLLLLTRGSQLPTQHALLINRDADGWLDTSAPYLPNVATSLWGGNWAIRLTICQTHTWGLCVFERV